MIIVHPDLEKIIEIKNKRVTEWIIESPELFSQYLIELSLQIDGESGRFVLSENDKEMDFSKYATIILNPLEISLNDKKIISKVYSQLKEIAVNETYYMRTKEVLSLFQQYLLELEYNCDVMLHINEDVDLQGIFKLFGIKIEEDPLSFFERLLEYIRIQNVILGKMLIILVNIRSYLTEQQLKDFFLFIQYNEIEVLMIESFQRDFTNATNKYIIDKDKCEI